MLASWQVCKQGKFASLHAPARAAAEGTVRDLELNAERVVPRPPLQNRIFRVARRGNPGGGIRTLMTYPARNPITALKSGCIDALRRCSSVMLLNCNNHVVLHLSMHLITWLIHQIREVWNGVKIAGAAASSGLGLKTYDSSSPSKQAPSSENGRTLKISRLGQSRATGRQ